MAKKNNAKRVKARRLKLFVRFMTIVMLSAVASVSVLGFMSYSQYQGMKDKVEIDRIYKNIYVNDLYLGDLTKDEAYDKLYNSLQTELDEKTITLLSDNKEMTLKYKDFAAKYDFSEIIDQAYMYAKDGNIRQRYEKITGLEETPYRITYNHEYTYNEDLIIDNIMPFEEEVYIEPVDATILREDGEMIFTNEKPGQKLNITATARLVKDYLDKGREGDIKVVVEEIQPMFTVMDLQKAQSLLGTFSTTYSAGDTGRNQNIVNALLKINNTVLYPGEVFSTNKAFGAMTYDNGYRLAPEIVNGKLQDGYGGGVCQVSSTLYNAVLFAEVEVVERRNHSLKVAYVDYGFDATLAGDYIDFKFKNSTPYPLLIEAYSQKGNTCVVSIYGFEEHDIGHKIVFNNELVEEVPPPEEVLIEDPMLPLGERVIKTAAKTGYKYNVFKTTYSDDIFVKKEFVAQSYYKPVKAEILIGTGPAAGVEETEPVMTEVYKPFTEINNTTSSR